MIKVLFVVLILSTAAILAVGLAIHFRVKRHLDGATPELDTATTKKAPVPDGTAAHTGEASEENDHGKGSDRDT